MPRLVVVLALLAPAASGCRAPGSAATAETRPSRDTGRRLVYQGEGSLEGHFRRPGETRPFGLTMTFRSNGRAHRLDTTSWTEPDRSDASTETIWVTPAAVVRLRPDPSSPAPVRLVGEDEAGARDLVLSALEVDGAGSPRRRRHAHPRLGDVTDDAIYGAVRSAGGAPAAGALSLSRHELDLSWRASLRLVSAGPDPAADLAVPEPLPTAGAPPAPGPALVEPLADGVFQVALTAEETRTLVVELASSLVVLEASLTVAAGERIVDALAARFPGKPIPRALRPPPPALHRRAPGVRRGGGHRARAGRERPRRRGAAPAPLHARARPAGALGPDPAGRGVPRPPGDRGGPDEDRGDRHRRRLRAHRRVRGLLPAAPAPSVPGRPRLVRDPGRRDPGRAAAAGLHRIIVDQRLDVETLVQGWPVTGQPRSVSIAELRRALSAR